MLETATSVDGANPRLSGSSPTAGPGCAGFSLPFISSSGAVGEDTQLPPSCCDTPSRSCFTKHWLSVNVQMGSKTAFPEGINIIRNKPQKPIKKRIRVCQPSPARLGTVQKASKAALPHDTVAAVAGGTGGSLLMPLAPGRLDAMSSPKRCRFMPPPIPFLAAAVLLIPAWLEKGCKCFYELPLFPMSFQGVPPCRWALGELFNVSLRLLKLLHLAPAELK